jgi:hypothetical protein
MSEGGSRANFKPRMPRISRIGIEGECCSVRCPQSIPLRLRVRGRKLLEFFYQPVKFDCPITAESWAAIYLSAKHSVYAGWEEQPQPAPLGCGLSTSSTSLEAAINRGPNPP